MRISITSGRAWMTVSLVLGLLIGLTASGVEASGRTATAISSGYNHTCALRSDATVWCWGSDYSGQLGDGTRGDVNLQRLLPVQVHKGTGRLTGVKAIAAGWDHTCALRTDATVWCWGSDIYGQLGDGGQGNADRLRLKPVQVHLGSGRLSSVKAITTGQYHSCALRTDGTVWCWGYGHFGQLGDGSRGNPGSSPVGLRLLPVHVRVGSATLGHVKAISAGGAHTCARLAAATVWCWGADLRGQLGDGNGGDTSHDQLRAVQVVGESAAALAGVRLVGAGSGHTCAVLTSGTARCWGYDNEGQVGDGTYGDASSDRLTPVAVVDETGSAKLGNIKNISAGGSHTCALLPITSPEGNSVWCWGLAHFGQLGDGTTGDGFYDRLLPVEVLSGSAALTGVSAISAGWWHSCALRTDGRVWCWGDDTHGQLGDGTTGTAGDHARLKAVKVHLPL